MKLKKHQPILEVIVVAILTFLLHKLFFYLNANNSKFQNFHTSVEALYGFFTICSVIILFILIKVKEKSQEQVGYVFLFVTCTKMGIAYAVLSPILHSGNPNVGIQKINFFIIFAVFLAIETVVTIRILNNKQ
jgi:hypothetical protein